MDANSSVVHHLVVESSVEFDQIVAYLPRVVADGLVRELDEAGAIFRYDAQSQRAYFLRREGSTVSVWTWDEVRTAAECGELVGQIARLDEPFDLEQAQEVYLRATGRSAAG